MKKILILVILSMLTFSQANAAQSHGEKIRIAINQDLMGKSVVCPKGEGLRDKPNLLVALNTSVKSDDIFVDDRDNSPKVGIFFEREKVIGGLWSFPETRTVITYVNFNLSEDLKNVVSINVKDADYTSNTHNTGTIARPEYEPEIIEHVLSDFTCDVI
ncbi:MAG: hypothetical protein N4A33_01780 [Bacteriovoracaceae bacterium]|nr:hypothetical protein [Bacteriovoracaceae bacterium]